MSAPPSSWPWPTVASSTPWRAWTAPANGPCAPPATSDRVLVEIGDNGPGIPEAAAAHILELAYATKPGQGHRPGARHRLADRRPAPPRRPTLHLGPRRHPLPGAAASGPERVTPAPSGSDRLAQLAPVGGDSPDHEHVQGDDQQRPERVVGNEQEVGQGAEHGQGDGRGPGPGPARQQPSRRRPPAGRPAGGSSPRWWRRTGTGSCGSRHRTRSRRWRSGPARPGTRPT